MSSTITLITIFTISTVFQIPIIMAKNYYVHDTWKKIIRPKRIQFKAICPNTNSISNYFKEDFLGAYRHCAGQGKQLATVDSDHEQDDLVRAINESSNSHLSMWVGGMGSGQRNTFVWMPTGQPFKYKNWHEDQPNDLGKVNCVLIWTGKGAFKWADFDCMAACYFVCEDKTKE